MSDTTSQVLCRICSTLSNEFWSDHRAFYKCPECRLIFTLDIPEKAREEAHYKKQWETTDPGFWQGQVGAMLDYVQHYNVGENILDFGSGSGEATRELQRRGFQVTPLEPMIHGYLKDQSYPEPFDLVVGIEVIEHLPDIWGELKEIEKVLVPGGILFFSTLFTNAFIDTPQEVESFKTWWYKDDPTHLSFFCNQSISKLAEMGNYDIDIFGDNVFIVRKGGA